MESRVQYDLFGAAHLAQDLGLREKVAYVLEHHPEARDDDRLLTLWYWWEWNGLGLCMTLVQFYQLVEWVSGADHPETIRRRRQEIQQLESGAGALLPTPANVEYRRKQAKAGPPKRRR